MLITVLVFGVLMLLSCEHKHSFSSEWTVDLEPTCIDAGSKSYHCAECEELDSVTEIPANGHAWSEPTVLVYPTCTEVGTQEYSCLNCEEKYTEEIPALGHSWGVLTVVSEATCLNQGVKEAPCLHYGCEEKYTEHIDMPKFTSNEIFDMASNSVAEIATYDKSGAALGLGSCFVYKPDGTFITNYHVIDGACTAEITLNGTKYDVRQVLAYDIDRDIAVLKINADNLPVLPVCSKELQTGSTVYALGSSQGLTATFSNGIISHTAREMDGVIYVQHNAAISSGNSGGPLINEFAEIVGINTFTIKDSQNLNFAIFASELDKLSYETPMTLREVYDKECDAFLKVKNYLIKNGTLSSDTTFYSISFETRYTSDYESILSAIYYTPESNKIQFVLYYDDCVVFLDTTSLDENYNWKYVDLYYEAGMSGTLNAANFHSYSILSYDYNNISSSSQRSIHLDYASAMIVNICSNMDDDLAIMGVTAEDLGFIWF